MTPTPANQSSAGEVQQVRRQLLSHIIAYVQRQRTGNLPASPAALPPVSNPGPSAATSEN